MLKVLKFVNLVTLTHMDDFQMTKMTDKENMKVLENMDQDTILEYVWENLMDDIQDMMRDASEPDDRYDRD